MLGPARRRSGGQSTPPFDRGLAAGTPPREAFRAYVTQDAIRLVAYGRALATASLRAPEPREGFFADAAKTALAVERALHERRRRVAANRDTRAIGAARRARR